VTNLNKTAPLPPVNLFAPDDNPPHPPISAYTYNADTVARTSQRQLYAALRTGFFDDRFFVTGGASRVWVDNTTTNILRSTQSSLKGHHDTYMAGVLGKPIEGISVYYNYSSNSSPTSFNNEPLWRDGKEHEFGLKTEFFNQRLAFTAAHFQIVQSNLVTPNPAFNTDPLHNPPNLISNQTNHGIELELTGGLTEHLSIVSSYTSMRLRDTFGRRPRNIPDHTLNALLNYHFTTAALKGFNLFAGMSHVGNTAGETPSAPATQLGVIEQVSYYVGPRTIYNIGAGYAVGRFHFNLNVDNVLNRRYAWEPASRFSVSPYPGINYRLTTTFKF
jgi:iron complex outermembrane recepter protein